MRIEILDKSLMNSYDPYFRKRRIKRKIRKAMKGKETVLMIDYGFGPDLPRNVLAYIEDTDRDILDALTMASTEADIEGGLKCVSRLNDCVEGIHTRGYKLDPNTLVKNIITRPLVLPDGLYPCVEITLHKNSLIPYPRKKIIQIETGMSAEPDFYLMDETDDGKTVQELMLEIAEQKEMMGEHIEASQLRKMLVHSRVYIRGKEISPNIELGKLTTKPMIVNADLIDMTSINWVRMYEGGGPRAAAMSPRVVEEVDDKVSSVVDRLGVEEGDDAFNYCPWCGASIAPRLVECPHCDADLTKDQYQSS